MSLPGEKDAWLHIVRPAELDTHMAAVGQAEANARIVKKLLGRLPLKRGARLLVHGCGTCQMFDYIDPSLLAHLHMTFADVSEEMLDATRVRLRRLPELTYEVIVDDIESSAIREPFDAVLLAMVLLHVDWRRSLAQMLSLDPRWVMVVEQEQPAGTPIVSASRPVPESIRRFSEIARPELIKRGELIRVMKESGYGVSEICERAVPDGKTMVGYCFRRVSPDGSPAAENV